MNTINEGRPGNEEQKKRGRQRKDDGARTKRRREGKGEREGEASEDEGVGGRGGRVPFERSCLLLVFDGERGNNAPWNVTRAPARGIYTRVWINARSILIHGFVVVVVGRSTITVRTVTVIVRLLFMDTGENAAPVPVIFHARMQNEVRRRRTPRRIGARQRDN